MPVSFLDQVIRDDSPILSEIYSEVDGTSKSLHEAGKCIDLNAVRQSIYYIFQTVRGSRFFNPGFGGNPGPLLFELSNPSFAERAMETVASSIRNHEPRVEVNTSLSSVDVDASAGKAVINLVFNMVGDKNNLFRTSFDII